jgi:hypothetical protein
VPSRSQQPSSNGYETGPSRRCGISALIVLPVMRLARRAGEGPGTLRRLPSAGSGCSHGLCGAQCPLRA